MKTYLPFAPTFRALVLLALILPTLAWGTSSDGSENVVTYRPVPLNSERTGMKRLGALTYRGGLVLSSRDENFGGLSSLRITPDGKELLATTDRGHWFSARLLYNESGDLSGLEETHLAPIKLLGGEDAPDADHDAESLAYDDKGSLYLGFEHNHRILRLPVSGPEALRAQSLAQTDANATLSLPDLRRLPRNSGLESLVILRDGRLLAIAEGKKNSDPSPAWLMTENGTTTSLGYARSARFRPTDATRLPNGDILMLERRFSIVGGVAARLRLIDAEQIRPGAVLDGAVLATFIEPVTVDNMEGIATRQGANGETLVYLLSDDNFNTFQRTLLLMFALDAGSIGAK